MRRLVYVLCLLSFFAVVAPAQAAPKEICFQQVPDCITFRFAEFWTDNGGLAVFGLPLSNDHNEKVGDQKYKVQYFERARFEYHKGDPEPYDVLFGRLAADWLLAQGRDWQTFPKADPAAAHYFAETGHAIAPQFWGFWSRNGLEFDGNAKAKSMAESPALFGYPISEAQMEPPPTARCIWTQWFERARFEYHPENKAPYDVLLGRLGADALAASQQKPDKPAAEGKPAKAIGCPPNAPAPAEGAQAWMGDAEPIAPGIMNAVCARLIVNGAPVTGAEVKATAHYEGATASYGPIVTGADGQVQIDFNIGKAKNRTPVTIELAFIAPGGQSFSAATSFQPRYVYKPYQPAGPVLPNIPVRFHWRLRRECAPAHRRRTGLADGDGAGRPAAVRLDLRAADCQRRASGWREGQRRFVPLWQGRCLRPGHHWRRRHGRAGLCDRQCAWAVCCVHRRNAEVPGGKTYSARHCTAPATPTPRHLVLMLAGAASGSGQHLTIFLSHKSRQRATLGA